MATGDQKRHPSHRKHASRPKRVAAGTEILNAGETIAPEMGGVVPARVEGMTRTAGAALTIFLLSLSPPARAQTTSAVICLIRVPAPVAPPVPPMPPVNHLRAALVTRARAIADGKASSSRRDCSGFVTAVYASAGKPLVVPERYRVSSSASEMLHAWAKAEGRAFSQGTPAPGDLAFFRDTFGPRRGAVTHVAMVEAIADDGTVTLLHYLSGTVRRDRMNLATPSDPKTNGYFRKKSAAHEPVLAGELFVAFARPE